MLRLAAPLFALALCLGAAPAIADDPAAEAAPSAVPSAAPSAAPPPAMRPAMPPPFAYAWQPPVREPKRQSNGAMGAGITLAVTATIGLAIGTGIYLGAQSGCGIQPVGPGGQEGIPSRCADTTGEVLGMGVLIASGVLAAGGVALWVWGAQPVPPDAPAKKSASARPPARPAIGVGPGSAVVRWSF